jgi:hypothetical protein
MVPLGDHITPIGTGLDCLPKELPYTGIGSAQVSPRKQDSVCNNIFLRQYPRALPLWSSRLVIGEDVALANLGQKVFNS